MQSDDTVPIMIYGQVFIVGQYDWHIYLAETTSKGAVKWHASKGLTRCREFIEEVIGEDGGSAKIELWDVSDKHDPVMSRLVLTIFSVAAISIPSQQPDSTDNG